jgi:hypothetical protein
VLAATEVMVLVTNSDHGLATPDAVQLSAMGDIRVSRERSGDRKAECDREASCQERSYGVPGCRAVAVRFVKTKVTESRWRFRNAVCELAGFLVEPVDVVWPEFLSWHANGMQAI